MHPIPTGSYPASGIAMRRFGIFESDLNLDFSSKNIPALITRLLEQCAVDSLNLLPPDFFRELSVGRRLEYLLALAAGQGESTFEFPFACSGCALEIELELTLFEIAEKQREADAINTVHLDIQGKRVEFRKPCGRDQENWAAMDFIDPKEAIEAMIATLSTDQDVLSNLDPETIERVDQMMDEADPLVNFLCQITCVECGAMNHFPIDLCHAALAMLRRQQKQLIILVHKLASHYHWSEQEVFAIPHWRRKEYLSLISAEG